MLLLALGWVFLMETEDDGDLSDIGSEVRQSTSRVKAQNDRPPDKGSRRSPSSPPGPAATEGGASDGGEPLLGGARQPSSAGAKVLLQPKGGDPSKYPVAPLTIRALAGRLVDECGLPPGMLGIDCRESPCLLVFEFSGNDRIPYLNTMRTCEPWIEHFPRGMQWTSASYGCNDGYQWILQIYWPEVSGAGAANRPHLDDISEDLLSTWACEGAGPTPESISGVPIEGYSFEGPDDVQDEN